MGLVLTRRRAVQETDPCPKVPATFLDPDRVAKIVRGLKKAAPLKEDQRPETAETEAQAPEPAEAATAAYEGPQREKRQVVASLQRWPWFGPLLAAAAWRASLAQAQRKAFVAEGARAIGRVWKTRFSSYVPILDFIHTRSYGYAAAKALGVDAVAGAPRAMLLLRGCRRNAPIPGKLPVRQTTIPRRQATHLFGQPPACQAAIVLGCYSRSSFLCVV